MSQKKPRINLAVTGHVDHGKSTLIGRLLVEHGEIENHEYEEYKSEAAAKNRSDATLAFISDSRLEERNRGLSITPSYNRLLTDSYYFSSSTARGTTTTRKT
jgi:elongation factor 1-alpha